MMILSRYILLKLIVDATTLDTETFRGQSKKNRDVSDMKVVDTQVDVRYEIPNNISDINCFEDMLFECTFISVMKVLKQNYSVTSEVNKLQTMIQRVVDEKPVVYKKLICYEKGLSKIEILGLSTVLHHMVRYFQLRHCVGYNYQFSHDVGNLEERIAYELLIYEDLYNCNSDSLDTLHTIANTPVDINNNYCTHVRYRIPSNINNPTCDNSNLFECAFIESSKPDGAKLFFFVSSTWEIVQEKPVVYKKLICYEKGLSTTYLSGFRNLLSYMVSWFKIVHCPGYKYETSYNDESKIEEAIAYYLLMYRDIYQCNVNSMDTFHTIADTIIDINNNYCTPLDAMKLDDAEPGDTQVDVRYRIPNNIGDFTCDEFNLFKCPFIEILNAESEEPIEMIKYWRYDRYIGQIVTEKPAVYKKLFCYKKGLSKTLNGFRWMLRRMVRKFGEIHCPGYQYEAYGYNESQIEEEIAYNLLIYEDLYNCNPNSLDTLHTIANTPVDINNNYC